MFCDKNDCKEWLNGERCKASIENRPKICEKNVINYKDWTLKKIENNSITNKQLDKTLEWGRREEEYYRELRREDKLCTKDCKEI